MERKLGKLKMMEYIEIAVLKKDVRISKTNKNKHLYFTRQIADLWTKHLEKTNRLENLIYKRRYWGKPDKLAEAVLRWYRKNKDEIDKEILKIEKSLRPNNKNKGEVNEQNKSSNC